MLTAQCLFAAVFVLCVAEERSLLSQRGSPPALDAAADNDCRAALANYAEKEAALFPGKEKGGFCDKKGSKPRSCHCWNIHGNADCGQNDCQGDYCDEPIGCLIYQSINDGGFQYTELTSNNQTLVHSTLNGWYVPSQMYAQFDLALLTENATFTTFDFQFSGGLAKLEAHVGAARYYNSKYALGYTFGRATGDLISPRIRKKAPAGKCHGIDEEARGFRSDELDKIVKTLTGIAFTQAAEKARAPPSPPAPPTSASEIMNPSSGSCIDADGDTFPDDGTKLQLYGCNHGDTQKWTFSNGRIESLSHPGKCVDADSDTFPADATKLQVWDCSNVGSQKWMLTNGRIESGVHPGKCIDADSDTFPFDGTKLQLYGCSGGDSQVWSARSTGRTLVV